MHRILMLLILLIGIILSANDFPTKAMETTKGKPLFVENELVVKFHPNISQESIRRFNQSHGVDVINQLPLGISQLRLPKGKSPKAMAAVYKKNPNVQLAHPNYIAYASFVPNDYFYTIKPRHWNFDNLEYNGIGMEEAWDKGNAGNGIVVAVLDTGIAYEDYDEIPLLPGYEYLKASEFSLTSFVPGYDYINDDAHPNDDNGHGTHVAGTIAQSTNDSSGTAGIAYNASLMPIKVLNASGSGTVLEIMLGIYHATLYEADVINLSLSFGGMEGTIDALDIYIDLAYTSDIVIVAASGNDYFENFVSYPANNPQVIAVGATDYYENVTDYSNKGAEIEITAPGGDNSQNLTEKGYSSVGGILQQTISNGDPTSFGYWYYMGTSMATPHVSAVIALIKEVNPSLSVGEIRTILRNTAEDHGTSGHDISYGYGIVDANKAALEAQGLTAPNNPPTAVISGDTSGTEDIVVNFDASMSEDLDLDTLTYNWNIDDQLYTEEKPTHIFRWGGTFPISLTVDDGRGGTNTTSKDIIITEVNDEPVVNIGGPYSGSVGDMIQFDASDTTDYDNEDGNPDNNQGLTYNWNFGDTNTSIGEQVSHSYLTDSMYPLTLEVSDTTATVNKTSSVSITKQTSSAIEQVALSDIFVAGNVSGTYTNTHTLNDGTSQILTERLSGGKPNNRYSYLEHQWEFNVQSGNQISISINASNDNTGESFTFAYSVDGTTFTDIAGNNASLPNTINGPLYIRVTDDTRVSGDKILHSLSVDQIIILTETRESTTKPLAPSSLNAVADSNSQVTLSWTDNSDNESTFKIERKLSSEDTISWAEIDTTLTNITTYTDTGLTELTSYDYRVFASNSLGKSTTASNSKTITTLEASDILLSAEKNSVKGSKHVILTWNSTEEVNIIRSDKGIIVTLSTGIYDDDLGKKVNPSYTYQVCETSSTICSNEVIINY